MITGFCTGDGFSFRCLDILCSVLLTLPALENVSFEHDNAGESPEEGQSLEILVKLLQSPTLRKVKFGSMFLNFTNTLYQAVAKALKERSEIAELHSDGCSFPEGGAAVIASALTTNTKLKCLEFINNTKFEDCLVFVAVIHPNTTLKTLRLHAGKGFSLDNDETKALIQVLQTNHGLEEIPGLDHHDAADVHSILQLNQAGRRYLVHDGSSTSKGVDVLSGVSNDINSVFLHLLENPRLCDRSAELARV